MLCLYEGITLSSKITDKHFLLQFFAGSGKGDAQDHLVTCNLDDVVEQHGENTVDEYIGIVVGQEEENHDTEPMATSKPSTPRSKKRSSARGRYCKCTNPVMTDILYETESACESTAYYMKKDREFCGRVCFDCNEQLSTKMSKKKVIFHWCKNSILEDDNGNYACDFIICPDCHKIRMDIIYNSGNVASKERVPHLAARRGGAMCD